MATARATVALMALLAAMARASYVLQQQLVGEALLDSFYFATYDDPTHGYVNYVDEDAARAKGLVSVRGDNKTYIGVDYQTVVATSARGRDSVRLESKANFTKGLFVLDLDHMPHGCGTWPAWWTCGPDWPNHGEIDVIEGVHDAAANLQTLHTSANCAQSNDTSGMTGAWACTNCDVWATSNDGCSVRGSDGSFGEAFNVGTGGVYAMEWTDDFIRVFFFPRTLIPADLQPSAGAGADPDSWGKPVGLWQLGATCDSAHFSSHQIILDTTFCGDWAGNTFAAQCPQLAAQSCESYVQGSPAAFQDAFWLINSMRLYRAAR